MDPLPVEFAVGASDGAVLVLEALVELGDAGLSRMMK